MLALSHGDLTHCLHQLRADLYNQGLNFLSAGNMPLPTMYLAFSVLFFLCLALWIVHVRRNRAKVPNNCLLLYFAHTHTRALTRLVVWHSPTRCIT